MRPLLVPAVLVLALGLGCDSEDPKLPAQLYEEARVANLQGKGLEARVMMKNLIASYPESPAAQQAKGDLMIIDTLLKREQDQQLQRVRGDLRHLNDALSRHRAKKGEYPASLGDLVPEYLDRVPETPWGHPYLYRAYVAKPIQDVQVKRGPVRQVFNTKLDAYYLACLGKDMAPGGEGLSQDLLISSGETIKEAWLPPIPEPQPVR
ncbi:MAG TPA: hypothetical protein VJ570_03105 [Holophagaceae bacterium]|nr:hypothetical protein [Holophagaceae bacterium]